MQNTKAIVTNNRSWGFFAAIKTNLGATDRQAGEAYALAGAMIVATFGASREAVVKLLDSTTGRHIADLIDDLGAAETRLASRLSGWGRQIRRELAEIQEELDGPPPSAEELLKRLSPKRHEEVRAAYYKAAEGLIALRQALSGADADVGGGTELKSLVGLAAAADRMLKQTGLGGLV